MDDDPTRAVIHDEIERALAAERERLARLARGAVAAVAAFFVLYLGAVFVMLMAVYILGQRYEPWIGAAVVGSTVLVVGLLLSLWAWRSMRRTLRG